MPRKFWTEEENKILRAEYPHRLTREIAQLLGRSYGSVSSQARILGIKKTEAFLNGPYAGRLDGLKGAGTRFKKGCTPLNKGKKVEEWMSPEGIKNCKKTWFKKGHVPHNANYDGHEYLRSDGYWYIRVKLGVYMQKQRYVWEREYGKIPPAHNIIFKDGSNDNFALDNLELVSNADLLRKNMMHPDTILKRFIKVRDPELMEEIKRHHPRLIEVARNNLKLKMKINEQRRD